MSTDGNRDRLTDAILNVVGGVALEGWFGDLHKICEFAILFKRANLKCPAKLQPVIDAMIAVDDLVRGIGLANGSDIARKEGAKTVDEAMAEIERLRTKVG